MKAYRLVSNYGKLHPSIFYTKKKAEKFAKKLSKMGFTTKWHVEEIEYKDADEKLQKQPRYIPW